ncbi:hypothetical protein GY45DRAFT_747011 [Cubamyces sp. BRFM 1775]|nr:hypothetical protein GY45DRAFT_747011 [Cubamyces sp. BRFM 1775]
MYALLHETGNTAPSDAPPFQAASYLTELTRPANAASGLWAPGLATTVGSCDTTGLEVPAIPVSYQMQMSDLVAMTRSIRGAIPREDSAVAATGPRSAHEDAPSSTDDSAAASPLAIGTCWAHILAWRALTMWHRRRSGQDSFAQSQRCGGACPEQRPHRSMRWSRPPRLAEPGDDNGWRR